ncbi:hypothetical protein BJA5080_00441 [Bradyrhizobium diazoefficiens SEMIA 5080]|uniref:Uncharacterized protein n=1 Tax=Bradyrhizobium diazoefficiens SEMIA 5080 TaxID=754504 RepID=A0A837CHB9_9BRAD|nr:hypothetical protein BJA5080_00441 [Bradyrhizobium diazoefficiens SEMIA 5080]
MLSRRRLGAVDPDHGLPRRQALRAGTVSPMSEDDFGPGHAAYFVAASIELNLLFRSALPVLFTTVTITSAMPAAIRQYSIAVAALSSARKDLSNAIVNSRSSVQRRLAPFSEW